jgi:hypothetical protein
MGTLVIFHQEAPHALRPKLSIIGGACTWLTRPARDLVRRAREQREFAGLDDAQLRELRRMAKRAGTAP